MEIKDEKELMKTLVKEIQSEIQRWKTERLLLIFLDEKGNIFYKKIVSVGYNKYVAYFYPNRVIEFIDEIKPHAVVWAHNHVTNIVRPSDVDDETLYWIKNECEKRNIIFYDSIIVMKDNNNYYSYRECNRLDIIPTKNKVTTGGK